MVAEGIHGECLGATAGRNLFGGLYSGVETSMGVVGMVEGGSMG